jgi:hypothetical protein
MGCLYCRERESVGQDRCLFTALAPHIVCFDFHRHLYFDTVLVVALVGFSCEWISHGLCADSVLNSCCLSGVRGGGGRQCVRRR